MTILPWKQRLKEKWGVCVCAQGRDEWKLKSFWIEVLDRNGLKLEHQYNKNQLFWIKLSSFSKVHPSVAFCPDLSSANLDWTLPFLFLFLCVCGVCVCVLNIYLILFGKQTSFVTNGRATSISSALSWELLSVVNTLRLLAFFPVPSLTLVCLFRSSRWSSL